MKTPLDMLLVALAAWMNKQQQLAIEYLREENRILREKLGPKRVILNDSQRARLAVLGKKLSRKLLGELCSIAKPDTILHWHRYLIARIYDGSERRKTGRPRTKEEIRDMIVLMALENECWGYTRITGALSTLGYYISRSTVRVVLLENGITPAPERTKRLSWKKFLQTHWESLAACDFFTIEIWTRVGLVRYLVFFIIDLPTRRVEIAGIAPLPDGLWMTQIGRNITDPFDGFLLEKGMLIHDRDPLYTKMFRYILTSSGVQSIKLPSRSPNLNAYAERFVLSIKSECLNRMIILGERHMRYVINEYIEHYHTERNHQGIGNQLIDEQQEHCGSGEIEHRPRLGGLLNFYRRAA